MHHDFTPSHYHRTLGSHEPVLTVQPGDSIATTTVDARGYDMHRDQVTPRGNPQTGPFFVEGAEPGDMLVLHIDKVQPNRRYGFCGSAIAAHVVEPDHVSERPEAPLAEWDVDVEKKTATLIGPESKLGSLTIPLDPMLGCFGVAARGGQAISTATSAEHGGNMDYRGFVAGTTVYFPVFEPGALFFLGDGHAAQGDGEIVGSGIEISMDVKFRLDLVKDKAIGWPRGENSEWIFTAGNARPLDQATQHATSEMIRWLEQDHGLDPLGAHLLLAQCVRYDLGNFFDPAYTMVCKVSKEVLAAIPTD